MTRPAANANTCAARIVRVNAHEVVVPAREGAINSPELVGKVGNNWDTWPIVLLEVTDADGVTALGECGRGNRLADVRDNVARLVGLRFAGPRLAEVPDAWLSKPYPGLTERHPRPDWPATGPVGTAMEAAALDWAGKRLGCRATELLGGPVRPALPVAYWVGRQAPDRLARSAERAREMGFSVMKMKSRLGDPVGEQVRAVHAAAGEDFSLTIDAVFQWYTPLDALPIFRELEALGGDVQVEDPFPQELPDHWHRVREACAVPLMWHARTMDVLRVALRERCCDGFNACGGLWGLTRQAAAIALAGYSCWAGSAMELGIRQLALMHAAAACPACVIPSDFASALVREHMLVQWDWPYRDGLLTLPDGPGLGVELDREALEHYRRDHEVFE